MSDQNDDMADTRPIKVSSPKNKKSTEPPVWLVGSGILLLSFCLAVSLVVDFLTLKGYLVWQPIIPVAHAAPPTSTPLAATAPVVNVASPTVTPLAATATPPVNGAAVTIQAATTATPTEQSTLDTATPAPITIPWAGNTYHAADCANLAPDLLFVISETGKPLAQIDSSKQLDDFKFQPQLLQQIAAAKPLCAQHVIFTEVNNDCTPVICFVETGAIIFPDANTAKTMFKLIDQSYQSSAQKKAMLNWPITNTNAASCFSESIPPTLNGSAIRCTTQDGNSVITSLMVSGDPSAQTFTNAAKQLFLDNLLRNDSLANQTNSTSAP